MIGAADGTEPLPATFLCRVVLPTGIARLQTFSQDHTVPHAIRILLDKMERSGGYSASSHTAAEGAGDWVLQVPATGEVLYEEDGCLEATQYVRTFLQYRRMPLLRLCRAAEAATYRNSLEPPNADAESVSHALLGHPLSWSSESAEVIHFRRAMMMLRPTEQVEYEAAKVHRMLPTYTDPTTPLATLPSTFMVKIYLKGQDIAKGFMSTKSQKVSELRDLAHGHYVRTLKDDAYTAEQMVLKFLGANEYLDGGDLIDYSTVRLCLKRSKEIRLRLLPHPWLHEPPPPPSPSVQASSFSMPPMPASPTAFPSVWSLSPHTKLRIRIVSLENMGTAAQLLTSFVKGKAQAQNATWNLHVAAGVYNGGLELCPPVQTSTIACDEASNPQWNEWLQLDLSVCHAPQAARACFTIYGRPANARKDLAPVPLGWVALPLYDHKDLLSSGLHHLRLWPGAEANPIGAPTENVSAYGPETPVLYVQFETFSAPLVLPEAFGVVTDGTSADPQRMPSPEVIKRLKVLIEQDPLAELTKEDKAIIWTHRHFILSSPIALPKFLQSVSWADHRQVQEMHALLGRWAPLKPVAALELLDAKFADAQIRSYAVGCLEDFSDNDLEMYVLQLVQVLKYEARHDSALARFLLRRALSSPHLVGHQFFWCLKAEMHLPEVSERFGLLLQEYLRSCGPHRQDVELQCNVERMLVASAELVKTVKKGERKAVLQAELRKMTFPPRFPLPLGPRFECSGLRIEKCKTMDSKKVPLWLVFTNADPVGADLYVIFKCGDDLRQDQLTLQMLRIMERRWERAGLDLQLSAYLCVATGDELGFIEVVLNSDTTANITKEYAGGASGAFAKEPMDLFLREHNTSKDTYRKAVDTFLVSLAGYCVATYVLGIGDRHNDNVMLAKTGHLFHIDFGHFLGNFKSKFGIKRERAPFVFTPDFAYVLGEKGSDDYGRFTDLCGQAYNVIRQHANEFINLFQLMLSTGIPELQKAEDIGWLRECMLIGASDETASGHFANKIQVALTTRTTQLNNAVHILAHS